MVSGTNYLQSVMVYLPNGKNVALVTGYKQNGGIVQLQFANVYINGTNITFNNDRGFLNIMTNNSIDHQQGSEMKIVSVIGYK